MSSATMKVKVEVDRESLESAKAEVVAFFKDAIIEAMKPPQVLVHHQPLTATFIAAWKENGGDVQALKQAWTNLRDPQIRPQRYARTSPDVLAMRAPADFANIGEWGPLQEFAGLESVHLVPGSWVVKIGEHVEHLDDDTFQRNFTLLPPKTALQ